MVRHGIGSRPLLGFLWVARVGCGLERIMGRFPVSHLKNLNYPLKLKHFKGYLGFSLSFQL